MQPIGYPVNHALLQRYWQNFMATGSVTAVPGAEPDLTVIQSWQRCAPLSDPTVAPHPPILREPALQSLLKAQHEIITVSTPFMEDMHQYIEGSGAAILLADGTGCLLALWHGDPTAEMVQARNLGVGRTGRSRIWAPMRWALRWLRRCRCRWWGGALLPDVSPVYQYSGPHS
ncbi:MAG: hypothetical protein R3D55_17330 [Chloroflexota bacterium]